MGKTAGWDVVWKSDYSYRILTAASFNNIDFVTAVQRLFESMGKLIQDYTLNFIWETEL
uniref:Toxin co-regulated pilus biosynthesis protein Q C-terminal domain-containing protein n=1 Tax=Escherichia coli TaxID=562 RepID=A0A6M9X575_ECOLX|nr:hypothetical protein HHJ25_23445 [Escherichia coli]